MRTRHGCRARGASVSAPALADGREGRTRARTPNSTRLTFELEPAEVVFVEECGVRERACSEEVQGKYLFPNPSPPSPRLRMQRGRVAHWPAVTQSVARRSITKGAPKQYPADSPWSAVPRPTL